MCFIFTYIILKNMKQLKRNECKISTMQDIIQINERLIEIGLIKGWCHLLNQDFPWKYIEEEKRLHYRRTQLYKLLKLKEIEENLDNKLKNN